MSLVASFCISFLAHASRGRWSFECRPARRPGRPFSAAAGAVAALALLATLLAAAALSAVVTFMVGAKLAQLAAGIGGNVTNSARDKLASSTANRFLTNPKPPAGSQPRQQAGSARRLADGRAGRDCCSPAACGARHAAAALPFRVLQRRPLPCVPTAYRPPHPTTQCRV